MRSSSPPEFDGAVVDVDALVQANQRLEKEARALRQRIVALETSRWWRLHPRRLLQRERAAAVQAAPQSNDGTGVHAFPVDFDEVDRELCRRVAPYTMTTPARIHALARAIEYLAATSTRGAIVECGVWRGGSVIAALHTLLRLGTSDRDVFLYDTFEGMTEPGAEDLRHTGESASDVLADPVAGSRHKAEASLEDVRAAVLSVGYPSDKLHFVQGRVEETLPAAAPDEIALLRLDTDWYSSTKHELVHLYPRLVRGGVLIVDDYGYWQGARKAVDEYLAENDVRLLLNRIDYTARIAVKP